ncbi:hypothetical protein DAEQUDRAFT_757108 [Daedalea quercina L-15889]|uniref:Uncharacterized protein n=1 Tax=Daedalea quercina L-15889 TaxID=1314783 RepID=A0A165Q731_9APHY|nr:hypothetical protein DAEQUDRAFT_757108 [Daedalea quercina L-15889]
MSSESGSFIIGVHAPPHWTSDLIGNMEWGENIADLDVLSPLTSISPNFAFGTILEDCILPISVGHSCRVRLRYFTKTQLKHNWRIAMPMHIKPYPSYLGRFSDWMDGVIEKVLLSTTMNGAVLRTYIVLAKRMVDEQPVRFQVVPYVGEFMVPNLIFPRSDTRYKERSVLMTSVYIGLPVIAKPEDTQSGSRWLTFWYRARLNMFDPRTCKRTLTVIEGPYGESPALECIGYGVAPLPGNASVASALLKRGYLVCGHSEVPGLTYHRLDLQEHEGPLPITYAP